VAGKTAALPERFEASGASRLTFGNPAKSAAVFQTLADFRGLCDLRSREVCLYRLSFKERLARVAQHVIRRA
jgi:hypothetical protein